MQNYLDVISINYKFDTQSLIKIAAVGSVAFSAAYFVKIINSYSYFKKRGIKTPKYKYISGNYGEIMKKNHSIALRDWTKELGKVYGYYEGHLPILVITDIDMVQQVFYDQISNFSGRKMIPFLYDDSDAPMFMASKNQWKRFRTIINPTFSPAKLKNYLVFMRKCTNRFFELIDKEEGKEFNLHPYLNNYAMDVSWNTGYGLDIDCQNDHTNPFVNNLNKLLDSFNSFAPIILGLIYFYEIKPYFLPVLSFISDIVSKISIRFANPALWIFHNAKLILNKRANQKQESKTSSTKDFVQILLECLSEEVDHAKDKMQYDASNVIVDKKITIDEICNQLSMFIFAGMETVSTTLSFCIYCLIKYPDEMQKIQDEIDEKFDFSLDKDDDIYENIMKLDYLDMFIKEVMRCFPTATAPINRRCTKSTTIKGIKIDEDQIVTTDVLSLHFDQEHWGSIDVNLFYPLRFSAEYKRNKLAYMPFGAGPKICIGKNFALLEMKYILIKILKKYDVTNSNPNVELELSEAVVRRPKHGIKVIFNRRQNE